MIFREFHLKRFLLERFSKESFVNLLIALKEHFRSKEHIKMKKLNKPTNSKKFSKIKFLEFVGFLTGRLNQETLRFEKSIYLAFKAYLKLIVLVTLVLKIHISTYFPQTDTIQLYIGNVWNALPQEPRYFIGLAGVSICLLFKDNYLCIGL